MSESATQHVVHWHEGKPGRVLIVGDIHGEFEMFQRLLKLAEFDERRDFVYALGDLVDRGPDSRRVLDWFAHDYGRASLMGNHEALMLGAANDWDTSRIWQRNGGGWAFDLGPTMGYLYRCMLRGFPMTAEIRYGEHLRVGLVHAEVRAGVAWSWMSKVRLQSGDATRDWSPTNSAGAIWGRSRFRADDLLRTQHMVDLAADRKVSVWRCIQPVRGIDWVICGHTVIPDGIPRGRGNVLWIETGAAYGGRLTAVDPLARVYWQVGRDNEQWGPLPWPEFEPVLPAWKPTRKEIEKAKEIGASHKAKRLEAFRLMGFG
ncbi:metallophosphoesterase [Algiphilus aromaticivorans]|uniref:metallophosphoesterase n=1 Tax=Algiphilus aromaticivorans TaxID=382454 RepID=UPI0005C18834|nr:metallophosphoesterase [Algiphilus aromaticivorans]